MRCTQCGQDILIWFEGNPDYSKGALCIKCKREIDREFDFIKQFNEGIKNDYEKGDRQAHRKRP